MSIAIKETQSTLNIAKILEQLHLNDKEIINLKSLTLNPIPLEGHIDFSCFEALESLSILKPFRQKDTIIKTGIVSIDLSNNLDFTNFYCDANVMPNFQEFILAHPNQVPYTTVYGDQNIIPALRQAKLNAYLDNLNEMYLLESNPEKQAVLMRLTQNFSVKQDTIKEKIKLLAQIEELNKKIKYIDEDHKKLESDVCQIFEFPEIPSQITFKQFPSKFINDNQDICTPRTPLDKIRTNNEIRLAKIRAERQK